MPTNHLNLVAESGAGKLYDTGPLPEDAADTIDYGGDIVTINDAQPTAEALAVKDGRILAVGGECARAPEWARGRGLARQANRSRQENT